MGGAQLVAGFDAPALAAQPLPVQQMRAGELRTEPGTAQPVDRVVVQLVGGRPAAQQRPAARLYPERPVGAAGPRRVREPLERITCELGIARARQTNVAGYGERRKQRDLESRPAAGNDKNVLQNKASDSSDTRESTPSTQ